MKKLFENWRKHLNEAAYEPGRAVTDIDTGEERMSAKDLMRDEVQDLADKFGVEASVRTASDGKLASKKCMKALYHIRPIMSLRK